MFVFVPQDVFHDVAKHKPKFVFLYYVHGRYAVAPVVFAHLRFFDALGVRPAVLGVFFSDMKNFVRVPIVMVVGWFFKEHAKTLCATTREM